MKGKIEEMPEQEKLNATVGQAPFATSFAQTALTPSLLGEYGAKLALQSSAALAARLGYESGTTPHGDLLPPITATDKAYKDAYVAQAQNTLGLQATKLMLESQNELNKANTLTPELIGSYTENIKKGLEDILKVAPFEAKQSLAPQFAESLLRTTSSLNNKMIAQQKKSALEQAQLFNQNQSASMYEAAQSGNKDVAKSILDSMIARSDKMFQSGMINALENAANISQAKISYYSGIYSNEALDAFGKKTVDQYLADFDTKKPSDLTLQEWESVGKNVLDQVRRKEELNKRNEESLYSEAERLKQDNLITPDFIARLERESTDKARFNKFMGGLASFQRKEQVAKLGAQNVLKNWTSTDYMATASSTDKNNGLQLMAQAVKDRAKENGVDIDDFRAEAEAMSTAATPVPSFTAKMNAGLLSGNPDLMLRNQEAYRALKKSNPKVLDGISKEAQAMLTSFEAQLENGNAPDVAALKAQETVLNKTSEQLDTNTALIKNWESKKVGTQSKLISWASELIDAPKNVQIDNLPAFAIHAKKIFKENMNYLNGDVEAATKMTKEGFQRSWGVSEVNGRKEYVFNPIEKIVNLDDRATPLIREDIYNQVQEQISAMKEAYDKGKAEKDDRLTFYYRLEERPTFTEFKKAREYLNARKGKLSLRPKGLIEVGNIDLQNRPQVRNPDGSISTLRSMSVNIDGQEVLLPTVSDDGKILSEKQAIELFKSTGRHLGKFDSPENATQFANLLHAQQESLTKFKQPISGSPLAGPMLNTKALPNNEEFDKAIKIVTDYLNPEIKIERVHDSGRVDKFTLAVKANPGLQEDAQGIIGNYDVVMRQEDGPSYPMNGFFKGPLHSPIYRPNEENIRRNFFDLVGLDSNMSVQEQYETWKRLKDAHDKFPYDNYHEALNKMGRGFR